MEDGKDKVKNIMDLLDMRQMKIFGILRKKYILGYVDLLEKCRALKEMKHYLDALEKFVIDKKGSEPHFRPMVTELLEKMLKSISVVILGSTGIVDPKVAEETLEVAYYAYLSCLVFAPSQEAALKSAVVCAFDIYYDHQESARKSVQEVIQFLEEKWPSIKNK